MSRSNPHKSKKRQAKQSILIYAEGLDEEQFLRHLKSLYSRNTDYAFKIVRGYGGSASGIVTQTLRIPGDYYRRVVVLDNDKPDQEMTMARELASQHSIYLFENTPCLEATLLTILDSRNIYKTKSSPWCKKHFQQHYLSKGSHSQLDQLNRLFPLEKLNENMSRVPELAKLIALFRRSS